MSRLAACSALFGVWRCQVQPCCRLLYPCSSLETPSCPGRGDVGPGALLELASTAISKTGLRLSENLGSCLKAAAKAPVLEILRLQGRQIKGRIIPWLGRKRIGLK